VGSNRYFYIRMAYKELWRMDRHLYILDQLEPKRMYQSFQDHVALKQQYRMGCNCNLVLDMERQLLLHFRELFFHQLGKLP